MSEDRTEAPTQKRKDDSRKKGEILKSRDLGTALVVLAGVAWMMMFGPKLVAGCREVMRASFTFGRSEVEDFRPMAPLIEAFWRLAAPLGTTRRPSTSVSVADVPSPRRLIALPCVELPPYYCHLVTPVAVVTVLIRISLPTRHTILWR